LLAFFLLQLLALFAIMPRGTIAFIGLMLRHFPRLSRRHAELEAWLEFDLDYDETRR